MKHPLKSKTVLINVLMIVIAVANQATDLVPVDAELWALIISVLNLVLRYVTDKPIGFGKEEKG